MEGSYKAASHLHIDGSQIQFSWPLPSLPRLLVAVKQHGAQHGTWWNSTGHSRLPQHHLLELITTNSTGIVLDDLLSRCLGITTKESFRSTGLGRFFAGVGVEERSQDTQVHWVCMSHNTWSQEDGQVSSELPLNAVYSDLAESKKKFGEGFRVMSKTRQRWEGERKRKIMKVSAQWPVLLWSKLTAFFFSGKFRREFHFHLIFSNFRTSSPLHHLECAWCQGNCSPTQKNPPAPKQTPHNIFCIYGAIIWANICCFAFLQLVFSNFYSYVF